MGYFDSIPVRSNGDTILASWFNTIRTYLVDYFGGETIQQTSFAGASGQSGANVTGLIFDNSSTESATVEYTVKTATYFEKGSFNLIWNGSAWSIHQGAISGDNSGITFDVNTSTGQVTYSSGGETSTIKFKATTFNI